MQKILILVLCALMLTMTCALADAPRSYNVSGIYLQNGDQLIDMSALVVGLDLAEDGLRLHLEDADGTAAQLAASVIDNTLYLRMSGATSGFDKTYAIDPTVAVRGGVHAVMDAIAEAIDSPDFKVDLSGLFKANVSTEIEKTAPDQEIPKISFNGDVEALIKSCLTESTFELEDMAFGVEASGVVLPQGTYKKTDVNLGSAEIAKLLNMVTIGEENSAMGDAMVEAGVEMSFDTYVLESDAATLLVSDNMVADGETKTGLNVQVLQTAAEPGKMVIALAMRDGENESAVQVAVAAVEADMDAIASVVDAQNAVLLTDMDAETALNTLGEGLSTVSGDALGAVLSPIINAMLEQMDPAMLEAMEGQDMELVIGEDGSAVEQ